MPQHDLVIDNASGAAVRVDLNNALAALGSSMKGPSAPPAPVAGMMWVDDDTPSATVWTLKQYDGADWIDLGTLDVTNNSFTPSPGTIAETDIASAATTNIGAAASVNLRITGTTTITSFGTVANGVTRNLRFAGALTLTHNATSLILPGGANITTAAGDTAVARSLGFGNWVVVNYVPAGGNARAGAATASGLTLATARVLGRVTAGSGAIEEIALGNAAAALSLGINRGTEQATTSGTAIDFTGIPAGVRRITVMLDQVSTNSTSPLTVRLGTSGGIVATGYDGIQGVGDAVPAVFAGISTGFDLYNAAAAEDTTGIMTLVNQSGNLWLASFNGFVRQGASRYSSRTNGRVSLSGALTQLRLTTTAGTPTFDQGAINIMWEF